MRANASGIPLEFTHPDVGRSSTAFIRYVFYSFFVSRSVVGTSIASVPNNLSPSDHFTNSKESQYLGCDDGSGRKFGCRDVADARENVLWVGCSGRFGAEKCIGFSCHPNETLEVFLECADRTVVI